MLIATPPARARKVIEEVLAELPDEVPRPNCVVYTYPNTQPGWHERLSETVRRASEPAPQRQTVSLDRLFVRLAAGVEPPWTSSAP